MSHLVLVVDASRNLNRDRHYAVRGIAKSILSALEPDTEFAVVTFCQSISGYQTGRFRPARESCEALRWLRDVVPNGEADFSVLLRRLIYLPEPVQVLLLACGPIGRDGELFRLAELAPNTLTMWALALDGPCGQLSPLCRVLRGAAYVCDSLEYQRALQKIPISRSRPTS